MLWFIRDEAGLTGTKFGCGQALCGACTVIMDKEAIRACITSVSDAAGREVTTIEGLHPTGDHAVQKAWRQVNVPQCGYCQAGQIMQAAALLMDNPKPSHDQIREAMAGNICRCGCYQRIENAVSSRFDGSVIMNIITNPGKLRGFERHAVKVENVSRRSILKGLGIAGGFVLAAPVMSRPAFAYETGAGKMPHGVVVDPQAFSSRSRPTARSPSSRIAPRWERACAPACR